MRKYTRLICASLLTIFLGLSILYNKKTNPSFEKEPLSTSELSILTWISPEMTAKQFNQYDAVIVSDLLLAEKYHVKGVHVPIFFLPEVLDLNEFLQQPLKAKRNSTFTFGLIATSDTISKYESIAAAFIQAFGDRDDVILKLYLPFSKKPSFQRNLVKKLAKLASKNIFVSKAVGEKTDDVEIYATLDCYINVPSNQKPLAPSCKALSLGIPLITDQTNLIFTNSGHVLSANLNVRDDQSSLIQAMLEIYHHYDLFLNQAPQARNWVAAFENSHNKSLETMKKNLVCPNKLIFGEQNLVNEKFLQTNSQQLYQKYLKLMPPPAQLELNGVVEHLRSLNPPKVPSGVKGIDCVYVINLDERPERWEVVKKQFDQQSITPYRVSAINGWKIPKSQAVQLFDENSYLLKQAFGGALGCLLSHVSIYKNALDEGFETIWICEDDIEFKQESEKISLLLNQLSELDPEWDVLYTDSYLRSKGLQHPRPGQSFYTQVYCPINNDLVKIHGRFNTHSMIFSRKGLKKVYQYFTHGLLWNPIDIDIHYTPDIKEYCTRSNLVTSIYDSSLTAYDGSSDTQFLSPLNQNP